MLHRTASLILLSAVSLLIAACQSSTEPSSPPESTTVAIPGLSPETTPEATMAQPSPAESPATTSMAAHETTATATSGPISQEVGLEAAGTPGPTPTGEMNTIVLDESLPPGEAGEVSFRLDHKGEAMGYARIKLTEPGVVRVSLISDDTKPLHADSHVRVSVEGQLFAPVKGVPQEGDNSIYLVTLPTPLKAPLTLILDLNVPDLGRFKGSVALK